MRHATFSQAPKRNLLAIALYIWLGAATSLANAQDPAVHDVCNVEDFAVTGDRTRQHYECSITGYDGKDNLRIYCAATAERTVSEPPPTCNPSQPKIEISMSMRPAAAQHL